MTIQMSVAVRNARADATETAIGPSPICKIFTGSQPASCAAADSGTVLSTINCPADWMSAASAGAKAKAGTWTDASADASGTPGHFRLYASDGTTCHKQGSVTITGGGGDMTVDSATFTATQPFTITSFGWTEPHA